MKQSKRVIEALSLEYDASMYKNKPIYDTVKRLFDIVFSLFAILLLSWLFLIIIVLIILIDKQNPFYTQERVGKNGKIFKMIKFQTMNGKDKRPLEEILTKEQLEEYKEHYKVTHDPRITKFGKVLRRSSVDELPQLFNILVGHMSVVGYRAVIKEELDNKYTEKEQALLLKTIPGLTGYWACHNKDIVSYSERAKMELFYCYKRNIFFDFEIVVRTLVCFEFINHEPN